MLFDIQFIRADETITNVRACSLILPPQTMIDKNGKPEGYAVEILESVGRKLNWKISYTYASWMRVVRLAKQGACDVVLTVLRRKDYESFMIFPKIPILNQENVLVILKKNNFNYDGDLEKFMRAHSVGLYQDKAIDDEFEKIRRSSWARIELTTSSQSVMKMLLYGRFDAAIENSLTAIYELRGMGRLHDVKLLTPALNITPAYITFPKAGKMLADIEKFDKEVAKFKTSSEYRVLEKYYLAK